MVYSKTLAFFMLTCLNQHGAAMAELWAAKAVLRLRIAATSIPEHVVSDWCGHGFESYSQPFCLHSLLRPDKSLWLSVFSFHFTYGIPVYLTFIDGENVLSMEYLANFKVVKESFMIDVVKHFG